MNEITPQTEPQVKRCIDVIQYLRPKGKRLLVTAEVSEKAYEKYTELSVLGLRVTVEQLMTGFISLAIEDPKRGDFAMEGSENNQDVLLALEKLLLRFDKNSYEQWIWNWHRNV